MRIILLLFGLAFPIFGFSQNLIQNPSFEISNAQDTFTNDLIGWQSSKVKEKFFNGNHTDPHSWTNPSIWKKPYHGKVYTIGIKVPTFYTKQKFFHVNELKFEMYKGFSYYFSSHVSAAFFNENRKPLFKQFGIAFSDNEINFETSFNKQSFFKSYAIDYKNGLELDTAVWTQWSGTYVANGNEKYLVLGCLQPVREIIFYPKDSTDGLFNLSADLCFDAFTLIPIPEVPSDTFFCEGDTLYLKPKCPPGSHYEWQTGQMGGSLAITKPGRYWVMNYSEFDTIKQWVNVKMLPNKANNPHYHLCGANEFIIDLDTVYPGNVLWFDGNTKSLRSFTQSGQYAFSVSNGQCSLADTINIILVNRPAILPKTLYSCAEEEIIFRAGLADYDSVHWSNSSRADSVVLTKSAPIIRMVFVQNCVFIDSCQVVFAPKKQIEPITAFWCEGKTLILNFDTFSGSFISETQLQVLDTGTINLGYSYGCDTFTLKIIVVEDISCGCNIYIPNAFSPNAKAPNDTFYISVNCEILEQHFEVYNRWGQKIYESNEKAEWAMPKVPNGVYLYKWSAVLQKNGQRKNVFETGFIQVLE